MRNIVCVFSTKINIILVNQNFKRLEILRGPILLDILRNYSKITANFA
jgi:hypothetical protein